MIDRMRAFYYSRIQQTMGSLLVGLTVVDLTGYHDSVAAFIGEKGYHAIRLLGAGIIVWRASQVTSEKVSSERPPGP